MSKQHTRFIPEDIEEPYRCGLCGDPWPCEGVRYRQSRCGCWQTQRPKRMPWYYAPGSYDSWKPVSLGGDEWCRRTLVLGVGPVTGALVIPLRECRGCEACGPEVLDGVGMPGVPLSPQPRRTE